MANLPSELPFGSLLVYPSQGTCERSRIAKNVVYQLKHDGPRSPGAREKMTAFFARRLREIAPSTVLDGFIPGDALLAPLPRSAPLRKDAYWPALVLCEELNRVGFGKAVLTLLERSGPLSPASRSTRRPSIRDHLDTIRARSHLAVAGRPVVLVDDVITTGTTAMVCATLLREENPEGGSTQVFAAARTRGGLDSISAVAEPFVGRVHCRGGYCKRAD